MDIERMRTSTSMVASDAHNVTQLREVVQQYLRKDEFAQRVKSALSSSTSTEESDSTRRSAAEAMMVLRNEGIVAELAKLVMDHKNNVSNKENNTNVNSENTSIIKNNNSVTSPQKTTVAHSSRVNREVVNEKGRDFSIGLLKVQLIGIEGAMTLRNSDCDNVRICVSWCGQMKWSGIQIDDKKNMVIKDDTHFFDIPQKCFTQG